MAQYSVSDVSKLTGVTIKTLHYYQKIGILNPSFIGDNKYRYYTDKEIDILQEIMFFRTMEIPLNEIKMLLKSNSNKSRIVILEEQLERANAKKSEMTRVIKTLEKTIQAERREKTMETKEKFDGLKTEESIYRTMQNMTIIFSKPMSIVFMVFCAVLAGFSIYNLFQGFSIYGDNAGAFVMSAMMGLVGVIGFILSFKNVFFIKTKDLLDIINEQYRHED